MPHMKTALAAATVLGLSSSPVQADAVAYGIVDLAISMDDGGRNGRSYQAKSGLMSASRLGFRGQEELGNGFRALFHLELGFAADTGVQNSYAPAGATAPSVGWNRKAYVGAAHERWAHCSWDATTRPSSMRQWRRTHCRSVSTAATSS